MRKIPYPHPGEILSEEFLKPMGITQYRLAKEIAVPQRRIGEIVAGARAVGADTGLRLARFFWHVRRVLDWLADGPRYRQGCHGQDVGEDQAVDARCASLPRPYLASRSAGKGLLHFVWLPLAAGKMN